MCVFRSARIGKLASSAQNNLISIPVMKIAINMAKVIAAKTETENQPFRKWDFLS